MKWLICGPAGADTVDAYADADADAKRDSDEDKDLSAGDEVGGAWVRASEPRGSRR